MEQMRQERNVKETEVVEDKVSEEEIKAASGKVDSVWGAVSVGKVGGVL